MNQDHIKGATHKVKGALTTGVGIATDDKKMEAEGNIEKAGGTVQNTVGGAKDKVRDMLDK